METNLLKSIDELLKMTSEINVTVNRKAYHFSKLMEIKKVYDACYDVTNCCLFETKYSVYEDYLKAYELDESKKVLDKLLKANKRYLINQLIAFRNVIIQKGEC